MRAKTESYAHARKTVAAGHNSYKEQDSGEQRIAKRRSLL
jgi:hypothetical protein